METTKVSLNPNTKATGNDDVVIAGVMGWLTNPKSSKHCTITGGPGAGKTWMIKKLLKTHKSFQRLNIGNTQTELKVCGTTHDSLGILMKDLKDDTLRTIYSLLVLVPSKGTIMKRDGNQKRDASYDPPPEDIQQRIMHLVCDEANFIPEEMLVIVDKWFPNVRIIYVGSENQLGTDSGPSKIFTQGWDNFYLNTTYRASNVDVQEVYDSSEEDVISKNPVPRYVQNPSVIYLNEEDWLDTIVKAYTSDMASQCITLAHTNKRVFELVGIIRQAQGKSGHYDFNGVNQTLISGSSKIPKKNFKLLKDDNGHVYIPVTVSKNREMKSYIGETYEHYEYLKSSQHTRQHDEIYPSLIASTQASTVHGAQGGTWDYTFLDLPNMYSLRRWDMETYRRAKHVAESRHRKQLFVKLN